MFFVYLNSEGCVVGMEIKYKALIADDEDRIRKLLSMYLEREEFEIDEARDGKEALELAMEHEYDVILLDIMMPEIDGITVCNAIREKKTTPILMLTAKGEETNRVQGFESGADDYIVKPFSPREVVLRVKAVLRRAVSASQKEIQAAAKNLLAFPHLSIDLDAYRVTSDDVEIGLTPKEFDLLVFLAKSPDKVFKREQLLKDVWEYEFFGDLRTVDTHVKRLREKLTSVSEAAAKMIVTVWGVGYKFEVETD